MHNPNAADIIALLRESGNDTYHIEAKDASAGMPDSIDETLSAFGNMPEGGIILLGVAENGGAFDVTGIDNPKAIMESLGSKARNKIVPALQLGAVEASKIEGKTVITCVVPPQPSSNKPFRVGPYGRSYTRSADGDYQLSPQEEQYLLSLAQSPQHDRSPVVGAHVDHDIDPELLEQYISSQLQHSPRLARMGRDEQLLRTNVTANEHGEPTLAALYAMGYHPQQFLPQLAIKAYAAPGTGAPASTRMVDPHQFQGPAPDLLDQAQDWVTKHLSSTVMQVGGHVRDIPELPAIAIRELIANAIVHRDLSDASSGSFIRIIKRPTKLIIDSPGGLWGITERQLGTTAPRSRNPVLYAMCSALHTRGGNRLIEAYATGIPITRKALSDAFLPAPFFKDQVISFQAILTSSSLLDEEQLAWLSTIPGGDSLSVAQKHALAHMRKGAAITNSSYRSEFPMDSVQARTELQGLVQFGLAVTHGSGRATTYTAAQADQQPLNVENESAQAPQPDREELIRVLISQAGRPLSKSEIQAASGLTRGQISPALRAMVQAGLLATTEDAPTSRNQRYRLL